MLRWTRGMRCQLKIKVILTSSAAIFFKPGGGELRLAQVRPGRLLKVITSLVIPAEHVVSWLNICKTLLIQNQYYVDKLTLQNHPCFNVETRLIDRRWNNVSTSVKSRWITSELRCRRRDLFFQPKYNVETTSCGCWMHCWLTKDAFLDK